jgi:hypothetical protein
VGETYFTFHADAMGTDVSGYGRYVDYIARADDGWKLHYRRVVPDAVPAEDNLAGYWTSGRGSSDPSYSHRRGPNHSPPGE